MTWLWLALWLSGASIGQHLSPPERPIGSSLYRISHYCGCRRCTGWRTPQRTASGRWPKQGVTVAADPRLHPLGSWVRIAGLGRRRVDDTGGAIRGPRLDVYVSDHEEARRLGVLLAAVRSE